MCAPLLPLYLKRIQCTIVTKGLLQPESHRSVLRESFDGQGSICSSYSKILVIGPVGQDLPTAHIVGVSAQELG